MSSMDSDGGSGGAPAAAAAFTQLQDMPLSSEVSLCSWCPTMDLCAVVSGDGQLHLHRLTWQLLWAAVPDAQITAVAWRPDGKLLAAGHRDGSVSLHDVETGAPRARRKAHYAPITQLVWLEEAPPPRRPRRGAAAPAKRRAAAAAARRRGDAGGGARDQAGGGGAGALGGGDGDLKVDGSEGDDGSDESEDCDEDQQQLPLRYKQLFLPPAGAAPPNGAAAPAGAAPPGAPGAAAGAGAGAGGGAAGPPDLYAQMLQRAASEGLGGGAAATPAAGAAGWPPEPQSLDLLIAADARGRVSLWAHGEVQLADAAAPAWPSVDDGDGAGAGPGRVLAVAATAAMDSAVFLQHHEQGGLLLQSASLQLLHQHRRELQPCASLFAQVQEHLAAAGKALNPAARDWRSAMSDLGRRMEQLASDLSDAGAAAPSPLGDLTLLLCSGAITQGLQQFLLTTLGEAGLRRLARQIDLAASALHAVLLDAALPRLSLAAFALGEMRGLAAAAGGLQQLGLEPHGVEALELCAVRALLRAERLRLVVGGAACQYRCFFSWLLRVLRMLDTQGSPEPEHQGYSGPTPTPEQMRDIRALLRGQLRHDVIGPQLEAGALSPEDQARADAALRGAAPHDQIERLLALLFPCRPDGAPRGASHGGGAGAAWMEGAGGGEEEGPEAAAAARAAPLVGLLRQLSDRCESAFERAQQIISCSMAPALRLQLAAPPAAPGDAGGGDGGGGVPRVCAAPPLVQPQDAADPRVCFACSLPAGWADAASAGPGGGGGGGGGGGAHVLVVSLGAPDHGANQRRPPEAGGGGSSDGGGGGAGLAAEGCLLAVPGGCRLVDLAVYRGRQLATLLQEDGADTAELALFDLAAAEWVPLSAAPGAPSAAAQCAAAGAPARLPALPARRRRLACGAAAPLAVSRQRGLACVISDVLRAAVFDLEEDEDEGEEEEQQEERQEEEEEGQQEGEVDEGAGSEGDEMET